MGHDGLIRTEREALAERAAEAANAKKLATGAAAAERNVTERYMPSTNTMGVALSVSSLNRIFTCSNTAPTSPSAFTYTHGYIRMQ